MRLMLLVWNKLEVSWRTKNSGKKKWLLDPSNEEASCFLTNSVILIVFLAAATLFIGLDLKLELLLKIITMALIALWPKILISFAVN